MAGTNTPAIDTRLTITSKTINGDSVAVTFNKVISLHFDYFKGMVSLIDSEQGEFYFGLVLVTSAVITIAGTTTVVVIS